MSEFLQSTSIMFKGELLIRLLIAVLCGAFIGYERANRGKGAGIRTHTIVAIASCLMMIVSQYGFKDFFNNVSYGGVEMRLDPSRLAAQIVTGVGFLGAGMIFIQKNVITGLTTAAGIWATAGIGMAIGCGMYFMGIACTVIIGIVQYVMHKSTKFNHSLIEEKWKFTLDNNGESVNLLLNYFNECDVIVLNIEYLEKHYEIEVNVLVQYADGIDKVLMLKQMYKEEYIKTVKI